MVIGHDIPFAIDDEPGAQTAPAEFALGIFATKKAFEKLLEWIAFAKREETRAKRIKEFLELAKEGLMPKQFRPVGRLKN